MEKYYVRNPNTGNIIDKYELIIDDGNISIISYKRLKPYSKTFTVCTDQRGYKYLTINLDRKNFVLSNVIYSTVNNRVIEKDNIIHHKDLNPMNNLPDNLVELTTEEHWMVHAMIHLKYKHKDSFYKIKDLVDYVEINNVLN